MWENDSGGIFIRYYKLIYYTTTFQVVIFFFLNFIIFLCVSHLKTFKSVFNYYSLHNVIKSEKFATNSTNSNTVRRTICLLFEQICRYDIFFFFFVISDQNFRNSLCLSSYSRVEFVVIEVVVVLLLFAVSLHVTL